MNPSVSAFAPSANFWRPVPIRAPAPTHVVVLFTLSVLLHAALLRWLLREPSVYAPAVPLPMVEIALLGTAAEPAQPAQAPAPPLHGMTPPTATRPNEPLLRKPKPPKPLQREPRTESKSQVAAPTTTTTTTQAPQTTAPAPATLTEASFHANYLHNPKPPYPEVAKRRGWEGRTVLRVQVAADGSCSSAEVQQSSGHDILDESALKTVKTWKFVPAKRGDTPIASVVSVPIAFRLDS
jgi:periplasmic protein TonB